MLVREHQHQPQTRGLVNHRPRHHKTDSTPWVSRESFLSPSGECSSSPVAGEAKQSERTVKIEGSSHKLPAIRERSVKCSVQSQIGLVCERAQNFLLSGEIGEERQV